MHVTKLAVRKLPNLDLYRATVRYSDEPSVDYDFDEPTPNAALSRAADRALARLRRDADQRYN